MKTKVCSKCGVERPEIAFELLPSGKTRRSCRVCRSEYAKHWNADNRPLPKKYRFNNFVQAGFGSNDLT